MGRPHEAPPTHRRPGKARVADPYQASRPDLRMSLMTVLLLVGGTIGGLQLLTGARSAWAVVGGLGVLAACAVVGASFALRLAAETLDDSRWQVTRGRRLTRAVLRWAWPTAVLAFVIGGLVIKLLDG